MLQRARGGRSPAFPVVSLGLAWLGLARPGWLGLASWLLGLFGLVGVYWAWLGLSLGLICVSWLGSIWACLIIGLAWA